MKKTTILLIFIIFISLSAYCQTGEIQKSFLDNSDFKILLGKKKIRLFEMTGAPIDSSLQNQKSKYLFNYLVKSIKTIDNENLTEYLKPLITCPISPTEIPKCTFLAKFCIEIANSKERLYLFFSELGACDNFVKVIKVNSLTHKETHHYFDINQFQGLF